MTDREALVRAIDLYSDPKFVVIDLSPELRVLVEAARKTLTQLPEKCGTCNGTGSTFDDPNCYACTCPTCHGTGQAKPAASPEPSEVIGMAQIMYDAVRAQGIDPRNGGIDWFAVARTVLVS